MVERENERSNRPAEWQVRTYDTWVDSQEVPVAEGLHVADLAALEVGDWRAKGARGSIVRLLGSQDMTGAYVLELSPESSTAPQRHLYDELVHVLSGQGFTTVWNHRGHRAMFEWSEGALFAIPLNANYIHHNASQASTARLVATNNAPIFMNLLHDPEFIFGCEHDFLDRFGGDSPRAFDGDGTRHGHRIWETNFVADVRTFALERWAARGHGKNAMIELADSTIGAHVSEFAVGTYKKAHRHGGGTHIVILSGVGYSLMWLEGGTVHRIPWKPGSFLSPPDRWFHQHFNSGSTPARYLAMRYNSFKWGLFKQYGADRSIKEGGDQIEYADQEAWVHEDFVRACGERGIEVEMAPQAGSDESVAEHT